MLRALKRSDRMKSFALLVPLILIATAMHGQNCIYSENPMPQSQWFYLHCGTAMSDGGAVAVGDPEVGMGNYLTRWAADGTIMWNKQVKHMDPTFWMWTNAITETANGGLLLGGSLFPDIKYEASFLIGTDTNAEPTWGRIYMLDSGATQLNNFARMKAYPGGGYVCVHGTSAGVTVSRLNAAAIPIWTWRYRPAAGAAFSNMGIFPLNNGNIIMVNSRGPATVFITCLAPGGAVLWTKTYDMVLSNGLQAMMTTNQDIIISSLTDTSGRLLRVNDQGNAVWERSFTYDLNYSFIGKGMNETANGHLVVAFDRDLIEFGSDGSFIGRWSYDPSLHPDVWNYKLLDRAPGSSDSLAIGGESFTGSSGWLTMMLTPGTTSLDCALVDSAGTSNVLATPTGTNDIVNAIRDSLKTWEMNIGPSIDFAESDPYCFLAPNPARPGFEHRVAVAVVNPSLHSTGPITATLTFSSPLNFVGSNPAPTTVNGNTLTWQFPSMGPNGNRLFRPRFNVPADPNLIGTPLQYTWSFTQDSADADLTNNTYVVSTHIVGAYDPNAKLVEPADHYLLGVDSVLEYTILFQNTGSAAATNVVLVDSLPLDVDVSTFELEAYSHACTYSLTGNGIITFRFNNINLPDSGTNESASHGSVKFRIRPILPLTNGQVIANRADIFFDFNPPIRTADATVVVTTDVGVQPVAKPEQLKVFPVPVRTTLNAVVPDGFMPQVAWAFGAEGRPVRLFTQPNAGNTAYDVRSLPAGGYVLTLVDRTGRRMSARFTKE